MVARPTTSRRFRIPTSCPTSRITASTSAATRGATFMGERTLPHHSSYGCPFFCNFCAVVNMVGGRWLAQSAERTAGVVAQRLRPRLRRRRRRVLRQQLLRPRGAHRRVRRADHGTWASPGGARRASTRCCVLDRIVAADARQRPAHGLPGRGVGLGRDAQADEQGRHGVDRQDARDRRQDAAATASCPSSRSCSATRPIPRPTSQQHHRVHPPVKRVNPATEIILYIYTPVPLAGELYDAGQGQRASRSRRRSRSGSAPTGRSSRSGAARTCRGWHDPLRSSIRDFERVLNAYYPTSPTRG